MAMEFDADFTGEDFASLRKAMFRAYIKPARLAAAAVIIFVVVLIIINTAIETLTYDDCGCGTGAGQLKLAALFTLAFSVLRVSILASNLRRVWQDHNSALIGVDLKTHYRLDEDGFASESAEASYRLPWKRFASFSRTAQVVSLHSRSGIFHMIPTSGLGEVDREAILSLLVEQGLKEREPS